MRGNIACALLWSTTIMRMNMRRSLRIEYNLDHALTIASRHHIIRQKSQIETAIQPDFIHHAQHLQCQDILPEIIASLEHNDCVLIADSIIDIATRQPEWHLCRTHRLTFVGDKRGTSPAWIDRQHKRRRQNAIQFLEFRAQYGFNLIFRCLIALLFKAEFRVDRSQHSTQVALNHNITRVTNRTKQQVLLQIEPKSFHVLQIEFKLVQKLRLDMPKEEMSNLMGIRESASHQQSNERIVVIEFVF
mmetsp:Transcript_41124/g.67656  ORF Transcript_41124/g.67656 Transcript_41124/m.67656 type:complete len:246 (+) Transcript_41124:809-1546(+)